MTLPDLPAPPEEPPEAPDLLEDEEDRARSIELPRSGPLLPGMRMMVIRASVRDGGASLNMRNGRSVETLKTKRRKFSTAPVRETRLPPLSARLLRLGAWALTELGVESREVRARGEIEL